MKSKTSTTYECPNITEQMYFIMLNISIVWRYLEPLEWSVFGQLWHARQFNLCRMVRTLTITGHLQVSAKLAVVITHHSVIWRFADYLLV